MHAQRMKGKKGGYKEEKSNPSNGKYTAGIEESDTVKMGDIRRAICQRCIVCV